MSLPPERAARWRLHKLPPHYAGIVMPLLLSLLMTCIVSFIATLRGLGWVPDLLQRWLGAWGISWLVAFPVLLAVLPLVKRLTALLVRQD
ncbi:DUF2798 domain-containing protein [Paucibacter sp. APW11]|uniref:DUF2798 domain-containing protein n=1 Tax=Roseateles aquae TaxID=3077235 RepID=A0ABU3PG00_9BURK|nr:DUF2798 domain-containing protein [Paucibacter sp. APW11]MDT9001463.1 DUF2798 domain-containing protein [Paucibacter sp. APW11]